MGAFIISPLPPLVDEGVANSRVPSLHGHYPASSLLRTPPPPSRLQPTSRSPRLYGLPSSANFSTGRGGLLQLPDASLSPCRRSHPAGAVRRLSQTAPSHAAFALPVAGSASGALHFRGHLCVHFRYSPVTRSPSQRWLCRWASGIQFPSSLPSKLRSFWLLLRRDCLPLNTPAFAGRTTGRDPFGHPAFLSPSPQGMRVFPLGLEI